jgi:hypothetical protein
MNVNHLYFLFEEEEEEEEELYYYCLDTIYFLQYLVTIIHLQLCSKIACIWIIVF